MSYHVSRKISGLEKGAIKIPQINGMSFKYPPSPILSQPDNILERSVCSLDKRSSECADTPLFCECLQLLQVPSRRTIEIILINEGNYSLRVNPPLPRQSTFVTLMKDYDPS